MTLSSGNSDGKNEAVLNVTKGKYILYTLYIMALKTFCMCIWSSSV